MKTIYFSLLMLLSLITPSFAQDFAQLSLNVPKGWNSSEEGAVVLISPKNEAILAIIIEKTEGLSPYALSKYLTTELKGTEPKPFLEGYTFSFKNQSGIISNSYLFVENNLFAMLTITGNHEDLPKIKKSIKGIGPTKKLLEKFQAIK